jgi:Legume lectin domain/PA14 domain
MINFSNFGSASNLALNGNAALANNALRLTPAQATQRGSVFYDQAFALSGSTSFQTKFQFKASGGQGTNGADGFTLVLQNSNSGKTALGASGGSLGYGGIDRSVAIEFDSYDNGDSDIDNNHISVLKNGSTSNAIASKRAGFDLNGGGVLTAWVDYVAGSKQLSVYLSNNGTKPGAATVSTNIDLAGTIGSQFFVGFSGGTGALFNTQEILNWQFDSTGGAAPPPPPPAPAGNGNGLKAEYFDNINFTNLKLTRTDESVNFDWKRGAPVAGVGADTFSVRWTGQVLAQYDETYTFSTTTDDGVRLWVNDKLVVNAFQDQAVAEKSGTITLEAGKKYNIKMEYYENGYDAVAKLSWKSRSQAKQIIPKSQLFSTAQLNGTTTVESQSRLKLFNFSHNPLDNQVLLADQNFDIVAAGTPGAGAIQADDFADAVGQINANPKFTTYQADSRAKIIGKGVGYEGTNTAQTSISAFNFFITGNSDNDLTNDKFKFDLSMFMKLRSSSLDRPPAAAIAEGITEVVLFSGATADTVTTAIASFTLVGSANLGVPFPGFALDKTGNFTLSAPTGSTQFSPTAFTAETNYTGSFMQDFTTATYLRLEAQTVNVAFAQR